MTTGWGWKAAFLFVLIAGIPACIFHAANGRWGNALMAASAVIAAIVLYVTGRRLEAEQPQAVAAPPAPPPNPRPAREIIPPARNALSAKLNGAILAGFGASVTVTVALLCGYILAATIALQGGNQLERWLYHLTENSLTNGVLDIPVVAIVANLSTGLIWAFVYVFFFEQRLRGPGWRKGMLFSLVPWALSLLVFFPLVGAGVLGMDLNAGPLPALGNLLLHLIYGAALGAICAIPEVTPSDDRVDDARIARWENDGLALGLLVGLLVGVAAGGALGMFVDSSSFSDTGILLAGGALGCAFGGWVGAFAGLGLGQRHEQA